MLKPSNIAISQTAQFLTLTFSLPEAKTTKEEADCSVDWPDVTFFWEPYLLKLRVPDGVTDQVDVCLDSSGVQCGLKFAKEAAAGTVDTSGIVQGIDPELSAELSYSQAPDK